VYFLSKYMYFKRRFDLKYPKCVKCVNFDRNMQNMLSDVRARWVPLVEYTRNTQKSVDFGRDTVKFASGGSRGWVVGLSFVFMRDFGRSCVWWEQEVGGGLLAGASF